MTFEEVWLGLPAEGWLSEGEARLLWDCAARTTGAILEVGCYVGRSSALLASFGRPLYCVDPLDGFNEDYGGDKIESLWRANLAAYPNATLFRQRVEYWAPRPVGLAYLDGDHSAHGTAFQIGMAVQCGARIVAVHDVNDKGDGVLVRDACLAALGPWRERVGRLAIWEADE